MAAFAALIGFGLALWAEYVLRTDEAEKNWWAGRAAAESAKTLAWRYAVAADPFPSGIVHGDAELIMIRRVREIVDSLDVQIELPAGEPLITAPMKALRECSFETRRDAYLLERLQAQWDWYNSRAKFNSRRARQWRRVLFGTELLGLATAVPRVFEVWDLDAAGILAAIVASAAAWLALKQHNNLSSAYSAAANDLEYAVTRIRQSTPYNWEIEVSDAEEAISREHALWLASRLGRRPPGFSD